jgi:hypothetical protein
VTTLNETPDVTLPNLALSLNNLALTLLEAGDRTGARDTASEAVSHFRRLADANPDAFLPNLVRVMNTRAVTLVSTGDLAAASQAANEVVTVYRQLADANPDAFRPRLAESLINYGRILLDTGDRAAGRAVTEEAAARGRIDLARVRPALARHPTDRRVDLHRDGPRPRRHADAAA